jgi:hypothetical protein
MLLTDFAQGNALPNEGLLGSSVYSPVDEGACPLR